MPLSQAGHAKRVLFVGLTLTIYAACDKRISPRNCGGGNEVQQEHKRNRGGGNKLHQQHKPAGENCSR